MPQVIEVLLKNNFIHLFIFGCAGSSLLRGLLSCCRACALGHVGSLAAAPWALSRAQAQQLWCMGLVALRHVGSSQTRDWTHVPCSGRWILYHWATKEAQDTEILTCMLGSFYGSYFNNNDLELQNSFQSGNIFSLKPLLPNMLVDGGESLEGYRYYRWALLGPLKQQVMFSSSVELRSHLTWL